MLSTGRDWLAGACDLVASLPGAAVLVDGEGRVAACNRAAEQIIDGSPLFIDVFGRLRTRIPPVQRQLSALLRSTEAGPRMLRVVDYGPAGDIILTASRVVPPSTEDGAGPRALTLVCLACEVTRSGLLRHALRELYGLTDEEAAAAVGIYHGQRAADFAVARGVDVLTAFALREGAMERLGAHRCADAARRVAVVGQALPSVAGGD